MVLDASYDKVELSLTLIDRVAARGIMRADVIFALQQAIACPAEYGFFHTEFAFVMGQITWATLTFRPHDPTIEHDPSTIDAVRQDDEMLKLAPVVSTSYLETGAELSPSQVWLTMVDTLWMIASRDKNSPARKLDWFALYGAHTEPQLPDGGPLPEERPILTVEGVITACWQMPLWMPRQGKMAEAKGLVSVDRVDRAEMLLRKGRRPEDLSLGGTKTASGSVS